MSNLKPGTTQQDIDRELDGDWQRCAVPLIRYRWFISGTDVNLKLWHAKGEVMAEALPIAVDDAMRECTRQLLHSDTPLGPGQGCQGPYKMHSLIILKSVDKENN